MNILSQVSKAMQTFLIVDLLLCEIMMDFRWICQSSGSGTLAARRGLANPRHYGNVPINHDLFDSVQCTTLHY